MFNLIRMDLYRLRKSRGFYICMGCLCFVTVFTVLFLVAMMSPGFREWGVRNGLEITGSDIALADEFGQYSLLDIFASTNIQGGFFSVVVGLMTAILVCHDFSSGFIKNISVLCKKRWYYIISKIIVVSIMNLILILLTWFTTWATNLAVGRVWESMPMKDTAVYMMVLWILFNAFSSLFVLIAAAVRSMALSIAAAIVLGGGMLVMIVYALLSNLGLGGVMQHTLYMTISSYNGSSIQTATLTNILTGLVFLIIYLVAGSVFMEKRDI